MHFLQIARRFLLIDSSERFSWHAVIRHFFSLAERSRTTRTSFEKIRESIRVPGGVENISSKTIAVTVTSTSSSEIKFKLSMFCGEMSICCLHPFCRALWQWFMYLRMSGYSISQKMGQKDLSTCSPSGWKNRTVCTTETRRCKTVLSFVLLYASALWHVSLPGIEKNWAHNSLGVSKSK